MLKLVIRRRSFLNSNYSFPLHTLSLHSDDDDPPFSPVTPNKQTHTQTIPIKSEPAPRNSDLPFDFRYSYTETNPGVQPIAFREPPRFSPFGPGRLDRKWTGTCAPAEEEGGEKTRTWAERSDRVLGHPLSTEEVDQLVEMFRHNDCNRQINIGNRGVTHNMLEDIHNHWKKAEAVRIKCLGVPTLDMENIVLHLEEKSGGKVIDAGAHELTDEPSERVYPGAITRARAKEIERDAELLLVFMATKMHNEARLLEAQATAGASASTAGAVTSAVLACVREGSVTYVALSNETF